MQLRKYRWSKVYESAEEELIEWLQTRSIDAERWEAEPGEEFPPRVYPQDKRIWCAEGSIIFVIDGKRYSLQPGDTLDLPANTMYEATAGFGGCACYEFPHSADS